VYLIHCTRSNIIYAEQLDLVWCKVRLKLQAFVEAPNMPYNSIFSGCGADGYAYCIVDICVCRYITFVSRLQHFQAAEATDTKRAETVSPAAMLEKYAGREVLQALRVCLNRALTEP
jgi:hypothetical protein